MLTSVADLVTATVTANGYTPLYDGSLIIKSTMKSVFMVAVLLGFWAYWNKVLLPRISGGVTVNRNFQVIEKLQIDPTTAVYLIKVGEQYESFVASNRQITHLNTLAGKSVQLPKKIAPQTLDFAALLKKVKNTKPKKRSA